LVKERFMGDKMKSNIEIKNVKILSDYAKNEVEHILNELPDSFNFKGYVKILYNNNRIVSVEPIEGTSIDYYKELTQKL